MMKQRPLIWCGEGDLFSCGSLKKRKLYTSRRPQNSESARNTYPSHTASHTGCKRAPQVRRPSKNSSLLLAYSRAPSAPVSSVVFRSS